MALRDRIGVWFSELDNNWEECGFYWFSLDRRKDERYRRCGDLPDGRHFGVGFVPAFGDPWDRESAIVIVGETGELQLATPSWIKEWNRWPTAMAASPSGRSLVWLTEDYRLGVWNQEKEGFIDWDGESLNQRLDDCRVLDAVMGADGILELRMEDGRRMGYLCDADLVLVPWEDGWTPVKEEIWKLKESSDDLPDSLAVMIRKADEVFNYYNCGVTRVCFEPGLRRVKAGILGENPNLEAVAIPASVEQVESYAFGDCVNLRKLAIEGDLSRVADWAEDAFTGCPCEESYLTMRRQALRRSRAQRSWRVPVRDVETVMHDPELYGLAKQIEASLGRHARFMLRAGDFSEIRILVEAPSEEKCLLAMLRFTQAAKKKGYLVGSAEEEEL